MGRSNPIFDLEGLQASINKAQEDDAKSTKSASKLSKYFEELKIEDHESKAISESPIEMLEKTENHGASKFKNLNEEISD